MPTLVAKSVDFRNDTIQSLDRVENDELVNKIARAYMMTLHHERKKISETFKNIYHRFLNVPEEKTSEIYLTIKKIEQKNNMSILKMNKEIEEYVGRPINWFKKNIDNTYSAIHIEKIDEAFRLVRKNTNPKKVIEYVYN